MDPGSFVTVCKEHILPVPPSIRLRYWRPSAITFEWLAALLCHRQGTSHLLGWPRSGRPLAVGPDPQRRVRVFVSLFLSSGWERRICGDPPKKTQGRWFGQAWTKLLLPSHGDGTGCDTGGSHGRLLLLAITVVGSEEVGSGKSKHTNHSLPQFPKTVTREWPCSERTMRSNKERKPDSDSISLRGMRQMLLHFGRAVYISWEPPVH